MFNTIKELTVEIESRIDITNVLDYLDFKKSTSKDLYFCKIHNEKHASFLGYKGQQTWKCQSSCGTGNIYQLYQKFFPVDDLMAIKEVATKIANIPDNEIQIGISKYERFLKQLSPLNKTCKDYLLKVRGFDEQELNDLKIGSVVYNMTNKEGVSQKLDFICYPYWVKKELKGYKIQCITEKNQRWIRTVGDLEAKACLYPNDEIPIDTEVFCIVAGEPDYAIFTKMLRNGNFNSTYSVRSNLTGEGNIPFNLLSTLKELKNLKEVRVFYDKDDAGKKGAEKLATHILEELETNVWIYNFPDELKNGKETKKGFDVSDWYREGYNIEELFQNKRYKYNLEKTASVKNDVIYEAERTILNAIFSDTTYLFELIDLKLRPQQFRDYRFKEVLKQALNYYDKHNYLDISILKDEQEDEEIKKALNEVIGAKIIKSITDFQEKVELIKFENAKTETKRLKDLIDLSISSSENRKQLFANVGKNFDNLLLNNIENKNHYNLSEIFNSYEEDYPIPEDEIFIKSPWEEVNKFLAPGIEIGNVSLLGAKTSTGKTTISRQWADFSASQGIHTAMYITETKKDNIATMTLSHRTQIENYRYRRKNLEGDYKQIIKSARRHYDNNLTYIEAFDMSGTEVIEDIRLLKRKNPKLKFVVVDHFHAFEIEKGFTSEVIYFNNLIAKFVKLALNEKIALLLPCHLKRSDNKFSGHSRPTVEDFAGSSNLEKRANTAFSLFYEGQQLMLGILKNRGAARNLFVNLEHDYKYSNFKVLAEK